jgi:hypothetical protein
MAPWWYNCGTEVLFADIGGKFTFHGEQFWGRAARASRTRKSPGRSLNFWGNFLEFVGEAARTRCLFYRQNQFVEIMKFTVMWACVSTA